MAFKNKEKKDDDKVYFSPQARNYFAKEMMNNGFNFDKFLLSKKAIKTKDSRVYAIEYETQEERNAYISKHVNGTPYHSFEAITSEPFWKVPFGFWAEIREQSINEENKLFWECNRLEETKTGRSYDDRAREKIKEFKDSMNSLVNKTKVPNN